MSLMNWTDEYSVGVEAIDEQHKKMFAIINGLYEALRTSSVNKELLEKIIQEMVDYADYHFSTEENHFEEFGYAEKDEHIKIHDRYREKVAEYQRELMNHDNTISFEILDFLEDWWIGHVTHVDKKYTAFFHEHGLR